MKVIHIAAECFPAAKAGGLGDVVGALPKYLTKKGVPTGVIIPKYETKWLMSHTFRTIFSGYVRLGNHNVYYQIEEEVDDILGFTLFAIHIPGLFDRPGIYADPNSGYGYGDELERWLVFQQAALQFINSFAEKPDIIHCHDHHTGLIPFLMKFGLGFDALRNVPSVITIHNGVYQGIFSWNSMYLLPYFYSEAAGYLDWKGFINPLATAIKCAWKVTTVSYSYMEELAQKSNGLESLIQAEWGKCQGILNGIDADTWDPRQDERIFQKLNQDDVATFKSRNKSILAQRFNINPHLPLIIFIGRLVNEKGSDLLPDLLKKSLFEGLKISMVVLGTGEKSQEHRFMEMKWHMRGFFDCSLEYNETLAHQLYAGADFIIMPSRVEPCGLNQMYAMRYGTIPIVRSIGGLRDTVWDYGDWEGRGFRFQQFSVEDGVHAIHRAMKVYHNFEEFNRLVKHDMSLDFSWESSADRYIEVYQSLV